MTRTILLRQDQMESLAPLFAEADAAHVLGKTGIIIGQARDGMAHFQFIEHECALSVIAAMTGKSKVRKDKSDVSNKAQRKTAARR